MKVPEFINRPEMILRDHFFDAFQNRHRGTGRGFRIEAVGAAAVRIGVPVNRRRVGIRAEHFDAGAAADLTDNRVLADDVLFASDAAGRVQVGPRGIILFEDVDISFIPKFNRFRLITLESINTSSTFFILDISSLV